MKTTLISILLFLFSISVTAQTAEYTKKDSISDLQWQNELHSTLDGVPKPFSYLRTLFENNKESYIGNLWMTSRRNIQLLGEKNRKGNWIVTTINKVPNTSLKPGEFEIKGTISENYEGRAVMLLRFSNSNPDKVCKADTAIVTNGKFYFKGLPEDNFLSIVTIGNYPEKVLAADIFLEEGTINLNLDSISHRSGTLHNDSLQAYTAFKTFDEHKSYIKRNMNNAIGRTYFIDLLNNWSLEELKEYVALSNNNEYANIPQIKEAMISQQTIQNTFKVWESFNGKKYKDNTFITLEGNKTKLSDYIGKHKILFINVWYSGCGPCIEETPELKEIYRKYKKKGLEIISVSTDTSISAWKEAVKKLDVPWIHVIIERRSMFSQDYAVMGVPHGILIGEDGTILALGNNLRPSMPVLENILMQMLDK